MRASMELLRSDDSEVAGDAAEKDATLTSSPRSSDRPYHFRTAQACLVHYNSLHKLKV